MQIAVSNIAWDVALDSRVARMLVEEGVTHIDVAPGKLFGSVIDAKIWQAKAVRELWERRGIRLYGMQSLLYGTQGLNLFGAEAAQEKMLNHLRHVCDLAHALGCRALTFGSPKNRDPGHLPASQAWDVACHFFRRLAEVAHQSGVMICLEANPERYGCRFITTTQEAAALVREVSQPGLRLQVDLGTCTINQEDVASIFAQNAPIVGHVHVSEPDLKPVDASGVAHAALYASLQKHLPNGVATLEMLVPAGEAQLTLLQQAIRSARVRYAACSAEAVHPSPPHLGATV